MGDFGLKPKNTMLNKYSTIALIVVLVALFGIIATYGSLLRKASQERDLYLAQNIAMQDSVRILQQENDSLTIAARFAMPGEDEINDALEALNLPGDIKKSSIDDFTEITYLPPPDSAKGVSIGRPLENSFLHQVNLRLRTHDFKGGIRVSGDSLFYDFLFHPRPQKITVLNRKVGPANERIVIVPGSIIDIRAYDRQAVSSGSISKPFHWRARIAATTTSSWITTGADTGPVFSLGGFNAYAGVGLYSYQSFLRNEIDAAPQKRLLGFFAELSFTL